MAVNIDKSVLTKKSQSIFNALLRCMLIKKLFYLILFFLDIYDSFVFARASKYPSWTHTLTLFLAPADLLIFKNMKTQKPTHIGYTRTQTGSHTKHIENLKITHERAPAHIPCAPASLSLCLCFKLFDSMERFDLC